MALRILVADKLADEGLQFLKQSGIEFDAKVGLKEDELAAAVAGYDALIEWPRGAAAPVMPSDVRMRCSSAFGAGAQAPGGKQVAERERSLAGDAANQDQHDCYDEHRAAAADPHAGLDDTADGGAAGSAHAELAPSKGGQPARSADSVRHYSA